MIYDALKNIQKTKDINENISNNKIQKKLIMNKNKIGKRFFKLSVDNIEQSSKNIL
jgi:hypothetical protein